MVLQNRKQVELSVVKSRALLTIDTNAIVLYAQELYHIFCVAALLDLEFFANQY